MITEDKDKQNKKPVNPIRGEQEDNFEKDKSDPAYPDEEKAYEKEDQKNELIDKVDKINHDHDPGDEDDVDYENLFMM